MAKRSRKKSKAAGKHLPGLVVDCPKEMTRACRAVLVKALKDTTLGFNEQCKLPRNRSLWTLIGQGATKAQAKYTYDVIPILQDISALYWMGVLLEFGFYTGVSRLMNISLVLFEGEAIDPSKIPLLRAEWGCYDEDDRAPHAQPHWHVYPYLASGGAYVEQPSFELEEDVRAFEPEFYEKPNGIEKESETKVPIEWYMAEKFHLAMAARWHKDGRDAHQEDMEREGLLKWIDGCTRYTLEQFRYMCG